jgi:hypothetical protein
VKKDTYGLPALFLKDFFIPSHIKKKNFRTIDHAEGVGYYSLWQRHRSIVRKFFNLHGEASDQKYSSDVPKEYK